jgi:ubiquinone/menaquinone biosynthesis C-methylase UbiE
VAGNESRFPRVSQHCQKKQHILPNPFCYGDKQTHMPTIQDLYNRRARLYATLMDGMRSHSTASALRSVLPESLPAGSHILDVGAGSGLATVVLARRYPESHLTALDYAADLLAVLQQRLPAVTVVNTDMNSTPALVAAPFQLIVSAGAVSEYARWGTVLPWLCRLLAPGGLFINVGVSDSFLGRLTGRLWQFRPRSAVEFAAACRIAGFAPVELHLPPFNIFFKHREEYIICAHKSAV